MQLKTPKRYRPGMQKRRYVGSWRGIRNFLLVLFCAGVAYWAYNNQTQVRGRIDRLQASVPNMLDDVQTSIPRAPTPTPDVADELVEANAAYQTGDYERAIERYRAVIGGRPNDLDAHYRLALMLIVTSNFGRDTARLEEALSVANRAINADPESAQGWTIRAMALVWLDRYGEAIAYAQRALEIDPDYVQAQAVLAQAYLDINSTSVERQAQANEAIGVAVDYLQTVGSAPNETIALVFRTDGYIAERLLDRSRAIQSYELARRAAPNYTFITAELALSYWGNGQIAEAIDMLNTGLESHPRDAALLFQLGRLYLNQGERESALEVFQRCTQFSPAAPDCHAWLGGMHYYAANYAVAIESLQKAIDNNTTDLDVWWQLGRSYAQTGYCNLAIPIFREGYQKAAGNTDMQSRIQNFILQDCNEPINPSAPARQPDAQEESSP